MTGPQRDLAGYCEFLPDGSRRPCYAPAAFVLVRPGGQTLRFSCADHLPAWASRIRGRYLVVEREEREQSGAGYRGAELGG